MADARKIEPVVTALKLRKRVAAYARISMESDRLNHSLSAQVNYFSERIQKNPEWIYAGVYADSGISGGDIRRRAEFQRLLDDCDAGKIELLITIMSSLAQEESRSISENTTWGKRKQFAEGKTSVGYSAFLGYDKDFKINEEQAKVVKLIYKLFLGGRSFYAITKELEKRCIKSPSGKDKWYISTVRSILTNEKYRGDALIQKEYMADFLDKTRRKNTGEIPQYYVEEHHEAIIPPDLFDFVQTEIKARENAGKHSGVSIFANKIKCGCCGGWYGAKVGIPRTSTAESSTAATRNMPTRASRAAQGI